MICPALPVIAVRHTSYTTLRDTISNFLVHEFDSCLEVFFEVI